MYYVATRLVLEPPLRIQNPSTTEEKRARSLILSMVPRECLQVRELIPWQAQFLFILMRSFVSIISLVIHGDSARVLESGLCYARHMLQHTYLCLESLSLHRIITGIAGTQDLVT